MTIPRFRPIIDPAVLLPSERPYKGPIRVGDVFAWEPDLPSARELCVVTRVDAPPPSPLVVEHLRGTATISCGTEYGVYCNSQFEGREVFNDESRFREAVVPTRLKGLA